MGISSASSQTLLPFTRDQVYDFVTNPHNWPLTYKGSGGIQQDHLSLPLKLGDKWTEKVSLPDNTYYSEWTLITAVRPWKWAFLQVDGIGDTDEAISNGEKGTCTIEYVLQETDVEIDGKQGKGTLFKRTLTVDLPRGVKIPDDLLAVCMRTSGIEGYHDAVGRELAKVHNKQ